MDTNEQKLEFNLFDKELNRLYHYEISEAGWEKMKDSFVSAPELEDLTFNEMCGLLTSKTPFTLHFENGTTLPLEVFVKALAINLKLGDVYYFNPDEKEIEFRVINY